MSLLKPLSRSLLAVFCGTMTASPISYDVAFEQAHPELAAAPDYQGPEWNQGLDYEFLLGLYERHGQALTHMAKRHWSVDEARLFDLYFSRNAHAPADLTLEMMRLIQRDLKDYDYRQLAAHYELPESVMQPLLRDLRSVNAFPYSLENANCYSYAVNDLDRDSEGGNPGYRTLGETLVYPDYKDRSRTGDLVRALITGAIADGLDFTGTEMRPTQGHYIIAMYVKPARPNAQTQMESADYHWVRQDSSGLWSHKYGPNFVTNIDYGGNLITDAATADMGDYRFIGYFNVPEGGVDVGNTNEVASKPGSPANYDLRMLAERLQRRSEQASAQQRAAAANRPSQATPLNLPEGNIVVTGRRPSEP